MSIFYHYWRGREKRGKIHLYMKRIVVYPEPILREKCLAVTSWEKNEEETKKELLQALEKSKIGIGLAAPQIGEKERIFVIKGVHPFHHGRVLVNPEIVDNFDEEKVYPLMENEEGNREEFLEGCLSFPDIYGPVKRWLRIKARWYEPRQGELVETEAVLEGLGAIVFQHELDHLEGILFIDHLKEEGRLPVVFDKEGKKRTLSWKEFEAKVSSF